MHDCPRTCGGMDSGGRPAQAEMGTCREKTQAGPDPSRTGTVIGWGSGSGGGGLGGGRQGREECWRAQPSGGPSLACFATTSRPRPNIFPDHRKLVAKSVLWMH